MLADDESLARRLQAEEHAKVLPPTPPSQKWGLGRFFRGSGSSPASPLSSPKHDELPTQYASCTSKEQKIQWLRSPMGQSMLQRRPKLQILYLNGKLFHMIDNPEWSAKIDSWLDGAHFPQLSHGIDSTASTSPGQSPSRKISTKDQVLPVISNEAKLCMLVDGYMVLRDLIPEPICIAAIKHINYLLGQPNTINPDPVSNLASVMTSNVAITNLYHESPLASYVHSLLYGAQDKVSSLHECCHQGQIAVRFPQAQDMPADVDAAKLGGRRWHIDGMAKGEHSAFTVLVGVALSDQTKKFCGNMCVHPGSHHSLQDAVKSYVASQGHLQGQGSMWIDEQEATQASEQPVIKSDKDITKTDLGEPTQVLLKAGDVMLIHQKVAHRGGPNYSHEIRRMVYFRVRHRNHAQLQMPALDNVWLEFAGMQDVL